MLNVNRIYNRDVREGIKLLDDESIDMTITSPPYWNLRDYGIESNTVWDGDENCEHEFEIKKISRKKSHRAGFGSRPEYAAGKDLEQKDYQEVESGYCKKCGAWKGQLGLEPTPDLYVKHLCDIYDLIKKKLKSDGTAWINIGDSYSQGGGAGSGEYRKRHTQFGKIMKSSSQSLPHKTKGLPPKSLVMIPFRFALGMVNRGWILRNTIIWHKPNALPSSVKDRFTVDFEYLFFFSKQKKYYFEQQFEPMSAATYERVKHKFTDDNKGIESAVKPTGQRTFAKNLLSGKIQGRNMRTTWSITTKAFKGAHFAIFPEELVETPIMSGCPEFICEKCGKPRKKIIKKQKMNEWEQKHKNEQIYQLGKTSALKIGGPAYKKWKEEHPDIIELSNCGCNAGWKSGIVLDPFMGAGTTAIVARKLGRNFIGFEINEKYVKISNDRVVDLILNGKNK